MTGDTDLFATLRARRDLSERPLAPGPLAAVQAFVNTVDLEHLVDRIATPEDLARWVADAGLHSGAEPTPADVRRAIALREALRALLLGNAGQPVDPSAHAALEQAARDARLAVRFPPGADRGALQPAAPGVPGALGVLVAIAYDAMADGSWTRLKACPRERCHCAFYDRSRNRSGVWCNMAVCGSREKAATYYRRRRGA